MRTLQLLGLLSVVLLAGCNDIPEVADPHQITVDGRPMTQVAFLKRYCQGEQLHPTCTAVGQAMVQDSTRGKMAKGW